MLKTAEVNDIIAADCQVADSLDELIAGSGLSIFLRVCVAEQKPLSNWIKHVALIMFIVERQAFPKHVRILTDPLMPTFAAA
jgi:hypothetical protein